MGFVLELINSRKNIIFVTILIPVIGLIILDVIYYNIPYEEGDSGKWELLYDSLGVIIYIIFAVKTHQSVLLSVDENIKDRNFFWDKRTTSYLLKAIAIILPFFFILFSVYMIFFSNYLDGFQYFWYKAGLFIIVIYIVLYAFSRLSLVFPSSAIGESLSFSDSWVLTKNNGFYMMLIMFGVPLITSIIYVPFYNSEVYSDTLYWIINILVILTYVFEIACLSIAYKVIIEENEIHSRNI